MFIVLAFVADYPIKGKVSKTFRLDSLGACQGIHREGQRYYLYGDREVGVMRTYQLGRDTLINLHREYRFTVKGQNKIKHPTGIARHIGLPTFIGNSVKQNPEGTVWKAIIYAINWDGFLQSGTLDGNLLNEIEDDACIQGTRPEYVQYRNKWYVATADYGNRGNEVRLYDPIHLSKASKTSEPGVLVKKFKCSPWVQNLHWIPEKNILVLIQNQMEGKRWRFTFLDLPKSLESGKEFVISVVETDKTDELEGFTFLDHLDKAIAVTSSRNNNISFMDFSW